SSVRYSAISSHSGSGSTLAPLTRSTQRPGSTWLRVRPEPGRLDLCDGPREALSPELADDPMSYLPTTSAAWLRHRDRPALGDYRPEGGAHRREGRGVTSPRASIVSGGDRRGRRHGGDLIASGLLASDQARRDSSTWASANGSWAGHSAVGSATSARRIPQDPTIGPSKSIREWPGGTRSGPSWTTTVPGPSIPPHFWRAWMWASPSMPQVSPSWVIRLHTNTRRALEAMTTLARSGTNRAAISEVKSEPGPITIWSAPATASS